MTDLWYNLWEKELIIDSVQASFSPGIVYPRVGIFVSPLNTNDGFSLSGVQEIMKKRYNFIDHASYAVSYCCYSC